MVRGETEAARADRWCDIGGPEGLAYKIGIFECVAREDGWRVDSPYIDAAALTRLGLDSAARSPRSDRQVVARNPDAGPGMSAHDREITLPNDDSPEPS